MNKHTPGPWGIRKEIDGVYADEPIWVVSADGGVAVAANQSRTSLFRADRNKREANAKLIAAAPDLLEALEIMLADYRTEGCPDTDCSICTASRIAEKTARAAIAKAKGE